MAADPPVPAPDPDAPPPGLIPQDQVLKPATPAPPPISAAPPPTVAAPPPSQIQDSVTVNHEQPPEGLIPEHAVRGTPGGSSLPQDQPKYRGSILPFDITQDNKVKFDPNTGIVGDIKSAATLPGDILKGKTSLADPATQQRAIAAGTLIPTDVGGFSSVFRTPETEELMAAGKGGLDAAQDLDVNYTTGGIHTIGDAIKKEWQAQKVNPLQSKASFDQLDNMLSQHTSGPNAGVFPLNDLEAQRQAFNGLLMGSNPGDRRAARIAIDAIDNFYENPGTYVDSGDAAQAAQILKTSRANAAAGYRSTMLDRKNEAAVARGEAPNADYNATFQSRMRWLSDPQYPARLAGFTDQEKAAIAAAGKPGVSQKVISGVNSLLGEKGMLGLIGERMGGPLGAFAGYVGPPALKAVLDTASNRMASGSFNRVSELLRQRSPLYQSGATGNVPKFTAPVTQSVGRAVTPIATSDANRALGAGKVVPNYKPTGKGMGDLPSVNYSPYRPPATGGVDTPLPQLFD
jgi:hypothetical protein